MTDTLKESASTLSEAKTAESMESLSYQGHATTQRFARIVSQ